MAKKIIRVFARRTSATPIDENVRILCTPGFWDEADEVHVSVTFSWDREWAEKAAKQWKAVAPVCVGGPAYHMPGGDFIPGLYMKNGFVITSRGCNNRCWFCSVPFREGYVIRELPVRDGWLVTDDNLLACSEKHIQKVFSMLRRQPKRPCFTGGLEAKLLSLNRAKELRSLNPDRMYFAYDTPDDLEPLVEAGRKLEQAGFNLNSRVLHCYVLIGYKNDTEAKAFERMKQTYEAGFFPMAMLYRDATGTYTQSWRKFQRQWANPRITHYNCKEYFGKRKNSRLVE